MTLMDVLDKDLIKVPLEHTSKNGIIEEMVDLLASKKKLVKRDEILRAVLAREALGSTGLADSIAIPHAKTPAVDRLSLVVGISRVPVDFQAQDGKPSQLFFLVIAPEKESQAHIEVLASIARTTASSVFKRLLQSARTADEVMRLFLE
jgi:mannitol/fructose-specific phosphotransferase system IIA component (Ntr-type)